MERASDLNRLAASLCHKGEWAEAEGLLRRALTLDEAVHGPGHPEVAVTLNNLAHALSHLDRSDEAGECWERAIRIFATDQGGGAEASRLLGETVSSYAYSLAQQGLGREDVDQRLDSLGRSLGVQLRDLVRRSDVGDYGESFADIGSAVGKDAEIAASYRRYMRETLADIRRRSEERGMLDRMALLMDEIVKDLTRRKTAELADEHGMSVDDILRILEEQGALPE